MFAALEPIKTGVVVERPFAVERTGGPDPEILLIDFLSEALYHSDVHGEAYDRLKIETITGHSIKGVLQGVKIEGFEGGEIKAVTHHDLRVEKKEDGYEAQVLFDL